MKKQEIYDKVCKHLAKQKTRAMNDGAGGGCAYRADDGKKCAVGCLIPYNIWKKEVLANGVNTGNGVDDLMTCSNWAKKEFRGHEYLLCDLQHNHDVAWHTAESLREYLAATAKEYKIKPGAEQSIKTWNP